MKNQKMIVFFGCYVVRLPYPLLNLIKMSKTQWISVNDKLPEIEGYYKVKFENGETDSKPFRIRLSRNIYGFMTEDNVTHWAKE